MTSNSSTRGACAWCGTPGRRVIDVRSGYQFDGEEPAQAAQRIAGNRGVASFTCRSFSGAWGETRSEGRVVRGHVSVKLADPDGPVYQLRYDPFCKLRCAEEFARAAHRAGFRRKA